eukprot:TRINITY_DN183_c0_g1_i2.p2 TRINITY_DN183_c0_g1~~TRINITY_DN183_c0_g1_i2.p2  ORF type:complete len:124 (-),score=20.00 TRINITY_DN183_c0_g1_i2:5-376(-)
MYSKNVAICGSSLNSQFTAPLFRPTATRKMSFVVKAQSFDPKTGVRCFVNEKGHLQCEKLAPGDYVVKQTSTKSQDGAKPGITYCYVTEDGELLCEGLTEGEYHVETATYEDLEKIADSTKSS